MKLTVILEDNEDRMAMMKAIQDKKFSDMRDSMSRKDISFLVRILKLKRRKQKPSRNIPEETLDVLLSHGLIDRAGQPTPRAVAFLRWLSANPTKEQQWHDKRNDANNALARGHLKRDNNWVDPKQLQARKIIRGLSPEEKEVFRKMYNRFISTRMRNLVKGWGEAKRSDVEMMQSKGLMDGYGNLTDLGVFVLNYYTTFKNDPNGMHRVPSAQRIGNYGDAERRRLKRMSKAIPNK